MPEVEAGASAAVCQYCGTPVLEQIVECERCGTVHHRDCFVAGCRCTTYGCGSRAFVEQPSGLRSEVTAPLPDPAWPRPAPAKPGSAPAAVPARGPVPFLRVLAQDLTLRGRRLAPEGAPPAGLELREEPGRTVLVVSPYLLSPAEPVARRVLDSFILSLCLSALVAVPGGLVVALAHAWHPAAAAAVAVLVALGVVGVLALQLLLPVVIVVDPLCFSVQGPPLEGGSWSCSPLDLVSVGGSAVTVLARGPGGHSSERRSLGVDKRLTPAGRDWLCAALGTAVWRHAGPPGR